MSEAEQADTQKTGGEAEVPPLFRLFNEIGIIAQLSSAWFNKRLPDGLHVSHFSVLNHMARLGDGKTPLALANAFQVTKGTMTHTLTTLHKRGYISLSPHPTDGRSKIVHLTPEGRRFRDEAIAGLIPDIAALSGKLDLEALQKITPDLTRLREVLDNNRDP